MSTRTSKRENGRMCGRCGFPAAWSYEWPGCNYPQFACVVCGLDLSKACKAMGFGLQLRELPCVADLVAAEAQS